MSMLRTKGARILIAGEEFINYKNGTRIKMYFSGAGLKLEISA